MVSRSPSSIVHVTSPFEFLELTHDVPHDESKFPSVSRQLRSPFLLVRLFRIKNPSQNNEHSVQVKRLWQVQRRHHEPIRRDNDIENL
jgi:hypothetical protein